MTIMAGIIIVERENEKEFQIGTELVEPDMNTLKETFNQLKSHPKYNGSKFHIEFTEEVNVRRDRRNTKKYKEMDVKFFIDSSYNALCYSFFSRTGYFVSNFEYRKIKSVSFTVPKDKEKRHEEEVKKLLNRRFDDQTWSNLTPESLKYQRAKATSIKSKFPQYVIEELKKAFENKTNYRYGTYGTKRDLSVETKMCEDGVFRAWFTSEFAGCGNGDYYLLINPTTAAFGERD